jgi:hypothetical protein
VYALILTAFVLGQEASAISQPLKIGQFKSLDACQIAANDAVMTWKSREHAVYRWGLLCVRESEDGATVQKDQTQHSPPKE